MKKNETLYIVLESGYPHNSDPWFDATPFESPEDAKQYLKKTVNETIADYTEIDSNGYQYCDGMEYVEYSDNNTSCRLCTNREDYVSWNIVSRKLR